MSEPNPARPAVPPKRSRWKRRVLALLLGLVPALLIGEVAVLLSGVNNDYRAPVTSELVPRRGGPHQLAAHGYVPYSTMVITYPTDPRGYFEFGETMVHRFNSEGWRDDEHPEQKPPDTFRILGLGDSYLFGQGVRREDLFIERLVQELSDQSDAAAIETINTGQPAYNTSMELQLLKGRGLAYDPDLVILCFVPNDVEPDIFTEKPKVEFMKEFTVSFTADDWLSRHSELWMFLRRTIAYRTASKAYLKRSIESYRNESEKWQACRKSLIEINDVCAANDIPLLVVVFPFFVNLDGDYPFQLIHDQVTSLCEQEQIPVLDLRETFRPFHGPELWVHPVDQHPNEQAHELAAEAMAEKIRDEGWVPKGNE